jgi:UDP-glucose 4-epimerase
MTDTAPLSSASDERPAARPGHVVVTGATGNLGSRIVPALVASGREVVGIARHRPERAPWADLAGVQWRTTDLGIDQIDRSWFEGAAAVVHLAWAIQPSHRPEEKFRTNVVGSERVFEAALDAGVPHVVHASSLGAYRSAPPGSVASEQHPTDGSPVLDYSWQKAYVERLLDVVEARRPDVTVTRLRPTLVLSGASAARIHGLFGGAVPRSVVAAMVDRAHWAPVRFQVVHTDDVADAVVRIVESRCGGAINLAAEPVLGTERRGGQALMRAAAVASWLPWRARIVAADPGWVRLAAGAPVLDTGRARDELGWTPRWTGEATLADLADGLRHPERAVLPPPAPLP